MDGCLAYDMRLYNHSIEKLGIGVPVVFNMMMNASLMNEG